jgi:hypothetical protein
MANLQLMLAGSLEVDFDVPLWIHHHRLTVRSDQVRRVRQTAEIELFEVKRRSRCTGYGHKHSLPT